MSAGFTSLWKRASRTCVKNPRPRVFPTAESLERRYALDAVPFAQIVSPTSNPLIGEEVNYTVRFDNTAVAQSDIGYSPFVDIVMPKTVTLQRKQARRQSIMVFHSSPVRRSTTAFTDDRCRCL